MSTEAQRTSPIEDTYPLSPIQEGMLFHCQLEPDSGLYLTQLSCRLEPLDADRFEAAWTALFARHTALRTVFAWKTSQRPLQVVGRKVGLFFRREDWRAQSAAEQNRRLQQFLDADAARPFDLSRAPLSRFALFELADQRYAFVWTHHHILIDGWSLPVLLAELSELYTALGEARPASLPPARPFRQLISWLEAQDRHKTNSFWQQTLGDFREPTPLGIDRPAATPASLASSDLTVELSADTTAALEQLARAQDLTLGSLTTAFWAVLLSRYAGRRDVLFGVTVSGRPPELPEVERMVGNFINTLPLRLVVAASERFLHFAATAQERAAELREHSHSPLVEAQGASQVPRGQPLFESIFFFQNFPLAQRHGGNGSHFELSELSIREATNYPLILVVAAREGLVLRLEYLLARFDRTTVARLAAHFLALLEGLVAQPEAAIRDLSILSPAERHQLCWEWNDSGAALPRAASMSELFAAMAARHGERTALVSDLGRRGYGELYRRAAQLAGHLAAAGVGPEGLVALRFGRGFELVELILGCFSAGAAYLPLDTHHPPERHRQILERAGAGWVIVGDGELAAMAASLEQIAAERRPRLLTLAQLEALPPRPPVSPCCDQTLAYVIYTSGSTGLPKGAMVEQRGMVNHLWAKVRALALGPEDRVAFNASPCFDISVWQMLAPLIVGAQVHIFSDEVAEDPWRLIAATSSAELTVLELVPSLLRAAVDALEGETPERRPPLQALRWLVPTGEALAPDLVSRFGKLYPQVSWLNAYGPTECSDDVTHAALQTGLDDVRVTIGRPVANLRLTVRDRELQPLPMGVAGELWVSGAGVGRGYRAEPGKSAAWFPPDPEGRGSRSYRTGDLARLRSDGEIEFLGRLDHQVKIRGHRIELGEIEVRLREHDAVADAVVVARREEESILAAYVVPRLSSAGGNNEPLESWRTVFDQAYSEGEVSSRDQGINLRVWVSSYTEQPLPEAEIVECFEDSVARLLALHPRDVLEIGCGTGLLLLRIAPHCRSYVGTDLSAEVLAGVARRAAGLGMPPLELLARPAHEVSGLPLQGFDLVVINEVVQYFPSVDYLGTVLEAVLPLVKPGGHLFVGGVRSLPLGEAFYGSVELARA